MAQPPSWMGRTVQNAAATAKSWVYTLIDAARGAIGLADSGSPLTRHGCLLTIVAVVVPSVLMLAIGRRRPGDFGCRMPNRIAWRIVLVGYVVSLPVLAWMVRGPVMANYYHDQLHRAGATLFVGYYAVNMFCEHFLFHGVLLALFRRELRWPAPPPVLPVTAAGVGRVLQWFGFAQPTGTASGLRRWTRWLGLPDGCEVAIVASAVLFGVIHLGKDPRELLLSLPGGVALAFFAYRGNSWLAPFVLHLATAGTAFLMIPTAAS